MSATVFFLACCGEICYQFVYGWLDTVRKLFIDAGICAKVLFVVHGGQC